MATVNSAEMLLLNLSGQGYSLLKIKSPFKKKYLNIDFSAINPGRGKNDNSSDEYYYLITETLIQNFSRQIHIPEIKILSVKPDTLFFMIKKSASDKKEIE
ncbi:MAG: hypothetical protein ACUVTX_12510 [Bacteroidales bacterium]